jgi:hypothetical protein
MTDYQTKAMITALKDISTQLKTINRNVNYLGRKLEMIDSTLQKHGIAIMPEAELTVEEPEYDPVVRVSDIEAWNRNFYDNLSVDHNLNDQETSMVFGWINRMLKDLAKQDKFINNDIQKGE